MLAIVDVDGTLVDTNYHHALAWYQAFRANDLVLPLWRIHRHLGMGGDQLVSSLTDLRTEREHGEQVRDEHSRIYSELIEQVAVLPGARELLEALRERQQPIVLASSASSEEVDHYLDLLDARDLADHWTTSADVEATKPAPDLVHCALELAGCPPDRAVLIGDSVWDVKAASQAGVPTLAVLSGGFGADELRDAGALSVHESADSLRAELDQTPLAQRSAA